MKTMNEKIVLRKCNTREEFDSLMNEINIQQTIENHPFLDRINEIKKKRHMIETQRSALNIQLDALKIEILDIEQEQRECNRRFHALKARLNELNPKNEEFGN